MSPAANSRETRRRWWWVLWGLLALSATGIAVVFVPPYLVGSENFPVDRTIVGYYTSLVVARAARRSGLAIGPFQFVPRLRARFPRAHRIAGRVYLISVVVASLAAAYSSAVTPSGFPLQVAFYILIAAWLFSAAKAYRAIRSGEVQLHRVWMIRNYALTFAAVTLRVYQIILMTVAPDMDFSDIYTTSAWASLVGNILVAEYFIVQRLLEPLVRRRTRQAPVAEQQVAGRVQEPV